MTILKFGPCLVLFLASSCGTRTTNLATSADENTHDAGAAADSPSDAATVFRINDAGVVYCGAAPCACSDGLDNDGDGFVDGFDPECTGAFDNFEDSFATGSHGEAQTASKCEGCFFDTNSSAASGGCRRARSCALDGTSASGNGSCRSCSVGTTCSDSCGPLVPNGCDCFGCCGVWRNGVVTNILLGDSSCQIATLDDPQKCARCTPSSECANACGPCELCPGRGVRDLPSACMTPSGAGFSCDQGSKLCLSTSDCGSLEYCAQGCCIAIGI